MVLTRQQRFKRRLKSVGWIILYEKATQSNDLPAWQWHEELLLHLGADGMSSDESDIEEFLIVFTAKEHEWRHPDVAHCMDNIDQQRLGIPVFDPRGSKPVRRLRIEPIPNSNADDCGDEFRIRGSGLVSTRPPADGLPRACYNPEWISQPKNKLLVKVSEEEFRWIKWTA
jgi:hypothetical protein